MKGVVFTEFLDYLEQKHGYEKVDKAISTARLENDGAFTAIGSYPFEEFLKLLKSAIAVTGDDVDRVQFEFGQYLFQTFLKGYPQFFEGVDSAFQVLSDLDGKIHPEVQKLYPDAELPRFNVISNTDSHMQMIYKSKRRMGDFAEGLIHAASVHFKEECEIQKEVLDEHGEQVKFTITKH